MTSLDVAVATSSQSRTSVKERQPLWNEGVFTMKVPSELRSGVYDGEGMHILFAQFAKHVKGGMINFFIHTDDPKQFADKEINAQAKIFRKIFEDGRSFLYVDLVPSESAATHRLVVEDRPSVLEPKGSIVFHTPEPLKARLIITPLKWALGFKTVTTGNSQLDRLLADGWQIDHQDENAAYLKKGDRTITHRKLKQKAKKGR